MLIVKFGKTGGDGLWSHVPSTLARIAVDVLGCGYHVDVRRRSSMNEAAFDLSQWRKAARARLLAAREAVPLDERRRWNEAVTALLLQGFGGLAGRSVGFCWPYRAEPDVRFFLRAMRAQGSRCALPVVIDKKGPLEFREWWPGAPTLPGVFDLPIPQGTSRIEPQAVLMPPVGFDLGGYRLGYGGGYFDRTLAAMQPQPLKIGVAFELSRLSTIHPQPYDVPMDFVVTERAIHMRDETGQLIVLGEEREVQARVAHVLETRGFEQRA
jgi:5,10-methenyltetrahydrofolate synthetase